MATKLLQCLATFQITICPNGYILASQTQANFADSPVFMFTCSMLATMFLSFDHDEDKTWGNVGEVGCRRSGMSDNWTKNVLRFRSPTAISELSENWHVWVVECLTSERTPMESVKNENVPNCMLFNLNVPELSFRLSKSFYDVTKANGLFVATRQHWYRKG